jgi:phasin family protein
VQAVTASGKVAFEGAIAFDRALLGYGRVAFDETVAHWNESLKAKTVRELLAAQSAFAKSRYETVAGQGRELFELTRAQITNAVAPLHELVSGVNKAA